MKQLRVVILGQGRSGRDIHGLHLKKDTERFKVVGVVDPMEIRRNRAAQEFGCETFSDYKQLFGRTDIDLIINATPSHLHYSITKDLLEHGFNVLCEKPCVPTVEEFDDLVATAKKNSRILLVFQQSRFANYFLKVKEVIASGCFGQNCTYRNPVQRLCKTLGLAVLPGLQRRKPRKYRTTSARPGAQPA
jgi:predicted dehydrogenase